VAKHFLPTRWWQKSTGIDTEQNYVTVTVRITQRGFSPETPRVIASDCANPPRGLNKVIDNEFITTTAAGRAKSPRRRRRRRAGDDAARRRLMLTARPAGRGGGGGCGGCCGC